MATDAPGPVLDRFGHNAGAENLYLNGHVFLILGGPSRNQIDKRLWGLPGVVLFAVNNVAGALICEGTPPQLWTYGDTTAKFHEAIWYDSRVLKLAPLAKVKKDKVGHKEPGLVDAKPHPSDCAIMSLPNVLGINRNTTYEPEEWLYQDTVNWGNGLDGILFRVRPWLEREAGLAPGTKDKVAEKLLKECLKDGRLPMSDYKRMCPYPRVLTTMFQALRLCYYLGFRNVYLVGCDFTMAAGYTYSFGEGKSPGGISGNNESYAKISELLRVLQPHFDKAGFRIFNTNPRSGLTLFPYLPVEAAVAEASAKMPTHIDLRGWYE